MYDDFEDLADKAKEYSGKQDICELIASQGYNEVLEKHTIDKRVEEVLKGAALVEMNCTRLMHHD